MSAGVVIRLARSGEAPDVLGVLREAAVWLEHRGEPLWREEELASTTVGADVERGRYALALSGDLAVGTLRFTLEDEELWPDAVAGEAASRVRISQRADRRPVLRCSVPEAGLIRCAVAHYAMRSDELESEPLE